MNNNANNNNNNMKLCELCGILICKKNYARHCKSAKHKEIFRQGEINEEFAIYFAREKEYERMEKRAYLGEHYVSDDEDDE
jgi:hypothetical protein